MALIIKKPITANPHREGTIVVAAPKAGDWGSGNYTIETYASSPSTGLLVVAYSGRFDNYRYYSGDSAS